MTNHFLPIFRKNAVLELEERAPLVAAGGSSLTDTLELCQQYRIRGIASLFLEGVADRLIVDLCRSGRAYLWFLQTSSPLAIVSKGVPLFDAIAATDWATTSDIAAASTLVWKPEEEFEDDYLYFAFLLRHFFLNAAADEIQAMLDRYEQVLAGADDPRFRVCQAFHNSDQNTFGEAILDLLDAHELHYAKLIEADVIVPEVAATERRLCVEALALLRLAERKSFTLLEDYPLVPSVTRESVALDLSKIDWKAP